MQRCTSTTLILWRSFLPSSIRSISHSVPRVYSSNTAILGKEAPFFVANSNALLRPKNVPEAEWETLGRNKKYRLSHAARIEESDFGTEATIPCKKCAEDGRRCMVYTLAGQRFSSSTACSRCRKGALACSRARDVSVQAYKDAAKKSLSDARLLPEARVARLEKEKLELMEEVGKLRMDGAAVAAMRKQLQASLTELKTLKAERKSVAALRKNRDDLQVALKALLEENEAHRNGMIVKTNTSRLRLDVPEEMRNKLERLRAGLRKKNRYAAQLEASKRTLERLEQEAETFRQETMQLEMNRAKIRELQIARDRGWHARPVLKETESLEGDAREGRGAKQELQAADEPRSTPQANMQASQEPPDENERQNEDSKTDAKKSRQEVAELGVEKEIWERAPQEMQDVVTQLRKENARLKANANTHKAKIVELKKAAKKEDEVSPSPQVQSKGTESAGVGDAQGELRAMEAEMGRLRIVIESLKGVVKENEGFRRETVKLQKELEKVKAKGEKEASGTGPAHAMQAG